MIGIILDAPNNKYSMWKSAMKAALRGEGIYIVDATRALEAQKYTPLYPEIKQHEQYGWYRKFDKRKFR